MLMMIECHDRVPYQDQQWDQVHLQLHLCLLLALSVLLTTAYQAVVVQFQ